ncbi:MAG: rod shape-determining protein RodA [Pseudomonadota bacterium]
MRFAVMVAHGGIKAFAKLGQVNWGLVALIALVSSIGFAMLYSAADGSFEPWAWRQMMRFAAGVLIMLAVAVIDLRVWYRAAYPFYFAALLLLVAVEIRGEIGMGARRWLDLWLVQIQPSELMKIALVLALARYFSTLSLDKVARPTRLVWPALLALVPAVLVVRQPDLGSAILFLGSAAVLFFLAGVRLWMLAGVGVAGAAAVPVAWVYLHEYQRQRVLTFFNPESDPLGAGYHIIQSKIALGSGGIWGKGFLQGTQSYLQFLPEKQTDFIFTMLSEEWGIVGGLTLIGLYTAILLYGIAIAWRAKSQFGRLVAFGVIASFYIYAFTNMAMVMGLLPVVGQPLPLVSYGGTAMMTLLIGFGLLMSVSIHRDLRISRHGTVEEG